MTSNHDQRPCVRCHTERTRSASGMCFRCRPAPTVVVEGDMVRIGAAFDLPADRAIVLAHRILDALTPTMKKENNEND